MISYVFLVPKTNVEAKCSLLFKGNQGFASLIFFKGNGKRGNVWP